MNINTLRDSVRESSTSDWHEIQYGDFFHHIAYRGDDSYRSQHGSRAVLKSDLLISLEWGLPTREAEDEPGHLWPREHSFPDPHIHSFWIDVLYAGSIVDRVRAYDVDGGRAYLPQYRQRSTRAADAETPSISSWEFTVEQWPYDLTKLINRLDNQREFDSYFSRAGFTLAGSTLLAPRPRETR